MGHPSTVKWRTLWRALLGIWIGGTTGLSLATLSSYSNTSLRLWIAGIAATLLLVWSLRDEDRDRIVELERRVRADRELRDQLVGRVADLMDSARRLDPIYRESEASRKRADAALRDLGKAS